MKTKIIKCIAITLCALLVMAACGRQSPQEEEYEPQETPVAQGYTGIAEATEPIIPQDTPAQDGIHGLISVVEYGQNRAYIMGSMHVGREGWYPLSPVAETAMDNADVFAFEIDIGAEGGQCLCTPETCECNCDPDMYECICLLMEMMHLSPGVTLSDFLPEDAYEAFGSNLLTFGIEIEALSELRPTAITELILYQIIAPSLGLSAEYSIDMYVFNRAGALGRPVIGLTDFNDHIAFIAGMPDEYQVATARYFSDLQTALDEMEELALIYENQDIDALTQMIRSGLAEAYEAFVEMEISAEGLGLARYWHYTVGNYRSTFFAHQIADLLTQTQEPTTFFITVGIAHLTREVNVFYTLGEMGFEVVGLY
ncbi:MAG: TraB/GumN family protein [Defluviitaleaceae bacterium]|nr:TraB/GumN family protein [Defluviitaleaceae bacterium]